MGLFKTLFNLAKLPVVVAADVVTAPVDLAMLGEPFKRTRNHCDELDEGMRHP